MKIRFFKQLLPVFILGVAFCSFRPAIAEIHPDRISLAISGGASMGAYEAGLIWGLIEAVRQAENTRDWSLGGELLPVEIASIAGTSAGGINSLLAALVWAVNTEKEGGFTNRLDDNIFRDVWLNTDVNRLLPLDPDSPQYLPDDAVLSRKDLVQVARELREKWRRPGTFRPGIKLPLGVTVTRVRPEAMFVSGVAVDNQRFYIPFEMHIQADGSVNFAFDPNDYPSLSDPAMILMPWPADGTPFSISDQQIEDALMTTSAFPVGFGRKRLKYCRKKTFTAAVDSAGTPPEETADENKGELVCPDGYELMESEFADGGLFDNLPIGLARILAESSRLHKKKPLPVDYIYLDPDRQRYAFPAVEDKRACDDENPPEACRELTYNFASEAVVLGGAIGTARKYELYRELTSDNWRLNLSQLSRQVAGFIDANQLDVECDSVLPYFDRQLACGDRLRFAAQLLALTHRYRITPILAPLSAQALLQDGIATTCRPPFAEDDLEIAAECVIDTVRLRKQLSDVLIDLTSDFFPENENIQKDIRRSSLTKDSDRLIHVTTRGGPITGQLLESFGAFLDYKFRDFDYYAGIYDAIMIIADNHCSQNFYAWDQETLIRTCRDKLSQQLYQQVGVAENSKSRYVFALMAKHEFGQEGGLRYAYDPMPPEDRDLRIIYDGLGKSLFAAGKGRKKSKGLLSTEREFFEYLKREGFEPTPPPEGEASLLALIMDDPEFWSSELVNRGTSRLVYLETQADAIYRAREPDPEKRDKANTALMGAGSLALRTTTYKYPTFAFSPSTAPESWFWRNLIPYEAAFDTVEGDFLLFWQPTFNFRQINAGIRFGLGFAGGLFSSSADEGRENYGTLGLDLTHLVDKKLFSGWGITPAVYHNWQNPEIGDQTTFGFDVHVNFFKNRVRIGLGTRDVINDAEDTIFFTIGIADLPGLFYWMSR